MTFKGRPGLRHQHVFAFDAEEGDKMLFDDASGSIKTALGIINKEVNQTLVAELGNEPLDLQRLDKANEILIQFYKTCLYKGEAKANIMDMAGPGTNIVKACSEALFFGVVGCFRNEMVAHKAIRENLHPCVGVDFPTNSKLLINVLQGGKGVGSQVKYSKFYLIIDGFANPDVHIPNAYAKFMAALKKNFSSIKGGEVAFKVGVDGAFFNAFASIADTFK
jgi:hypothetical protein